jgi:hypothetical protein
VRFYQVNVQGSTFNASQRQEIKSRLLEKPFSAELIPALTAVGAGIGLIFGPGGAAVGGAVGASVGFIAWIFR